MAFLALNANDKKTAVKDVLAATRKWGADEIPDWHFLTGSPAPLKSVWAAYSVLGSGAPLPSALIVKHVRAILAQRRQG